MQGKEIKNWADEAMFEAEEIDSDGGPEVFLLQCNNDPLGSIAAAAKAYVGEFVTSLADITDDERRRYLGEVQKTALAMPLESVNFHFRIRGVTRGFTHQMVRQRTAAYSQESTRFAVKSGVPIGRPPSLDDTEDELGAIKAEIAERYPWWGHKPGLERFHEMQPWDQNEVIRQVRAGQHEWEFRSERVSKENTWRSQWDKCSEMIAKYYDSWIDSGMPAEDARGMMPTNLLTQLNYFTSLRGLQDHAGLRLCTQAQQEWVLVWAQILDAIVKYGRTQSYIESGEVKSSAWQFEALARIFKPICFQKGKCVFKADFDRKCNIREKVDAYADHNVPSTEWSTGRADLGIPAIRAEEWTRADAAR